VKPIFKYSGGKSRELKRIKEFFPENVERIVEPFAGSCAVSFHFELPALIGDTRENVINALSVVKDNEQYPKLQKLVDDLKLVDDVEELNRIYYEQRDGKFKTPDPIEMAFRWIVIRQLVFSGIDRVNLKTGKINAPFGWYKKFACSLSEQHHRLLQSWEISQSSFEETLSCVKDGDWIFLDPPYLGRNSTYDCVSFEELQKMHGRMLEQLLQIKQPWLIVHSDCEFYREAYRSFNLHAVNHNYSQNFKGRDNSKQRVQHLYITNY
jgi:DNA adenine methylase